VATFRNYSVAVTMIVSFSISFAFMWRQRSTQGVVLPVPESTPIAAVSSSLATTRIPMPPAPAERVDLVVPPKIETPRVKPAVIAPSPSENSYMQPLPITIHIWNRPSEHRIEGAIQNIGTTAMTVTARIENSATHETSEFQLDINPGDTKSFSTDSGLEIHSHDHITFQSPPYQDRVSIVP
jgi:hypothetical protein